MRVLELYPKDFYVTMELSLKEINKIRIALSKAELIFDGKKPEEKEAVGFVKDQFYPMLDRLCEENKQYDT